jgi:MFS family permease
VSKLGWFVGSDADILNERQFQLLLVANTLAPLGTGLLSPILDSLVEPFGTSPANIGLMISVFTAPAIILIPIAGFLADRCGRRPVLIFGLLCFGAGGSAITLVSSFGSALFLRFIQGIGFAALGPIIITSIGDLYTGSKEAAGQGLRFASSGLVQMVSPLAAAVLVTMAWQYPFLIHLISFPVALVVYLRFDEPVSSDSEGPPNDKPTVAQLGALWALVSQRRAAAMVVARGTVITVWIGFLTYNSVLVVRVFGGTPRQAGVLAALGSLSYAASATQAGRITSYFESRLYLLIGMNVALLIGSTVVYLAPYIWVAYAGIVLLGIGFGVVLSIYRSIMTNLASPALRGGLVSLGEGFGRITATLTPIGMGVGIAVGTPQLGFDTSVQLVGVLPGVVGSGIGILCLLVLNSAPPIDPPSD